MTRAPLLVLILAVLSWPAAGYGAPTAACREACRTAIEGCIAWQSTALRDVEGPARGVSRAARAIRRGCTKAAVRQCRSEGIAACDTPVTCACGR